MARGSAPHDFPPALRKRGRLRRQSWRGQPDHKARPRNRGRAIGAGAACAILRPDASAMRLDDLFRDRQPQSGVLPEPLMRPVGVEAFEDPLQRILANPRPIVVDDDLDFRSHAAAYDPYLAAGFGKRLGVGEQIRDHLSQPRIVTRHRESIVETSAVETDLNGDVVSAPGFRRDRPQPDKQAPSMDGGNILALQFSIEDAVSGK